MRRILIADGDPHVLLLCRDELQDEGYEVQVATNAREVLEMLGQACPDLVVIEIMLPDMSGLETVQIIKGTCRRTPVIFHSTYSLSQASCPVEDIIVKTHDLAQLKKTVRRLLPPQPSGAETGKGAVPPGNPAN